MIGWPSDDAPRMAEVSVVPTHARLQLTRHQPPISTSRHATAQLTTRRPTPCCRACRRCHAACTYVTATRDAGGKGGGESGRGNKPSWTRRAHPCPFGTEHAAGT
jgi:hypothetical protein